MSSLCEGAYMTTPRLTARRTVLERHRAEVISLVMDYTDAQVARFYQVSREAVGKFRERHADEIAQERARLDAAVLDQTIAEKAARIAAKNQRWHLLEQVREARANGGTGMETGLVVKQYKAVGVGKDMRLVEEYKVDDGLLGALHQLEDGAAREMGHYPKSGDVNVQINNTTIDLKW